LIAREDAMYLDVRMMRGRGGGVSDDFRAAGPSYQVSGY
jgi:hypothetical protein